MTKFNQHKKQQYFGYRHVGFRTTTTVLSALLLISCGSQERDPNSNRVDSTDTSTATSTYTLPVTGGGNTSGTNTVVYNSGTSTSISSGSTAPTKRVCTIPLKIKGESQLASYVGGHVGNLEGDPTLCLKLYSLGGTRSFQVQGVLGLEFEDDIGFTQIQIFTPQQYVGSILNNSLSILFAMTNNSNQLVGVAKISGTIATNGLLNATINFRRIDPSKQVYQYNATPGLGYITQPGSNTPKPPMAPTAPLNPSQQAQALSNYWQWYYQQLQKYYQQVYTPPDYNKPWDDLIDISKNPDVELLGQFQADIGQIMVLQ